MKVEKLLYAVVDHYHGNTESATIGLPAMPSRAPTKEILPFLMGLLHSGQPIQAKDYHRSASRSVLAPAMFLLHVQDLPDNLYSDVRLYTDDTIKNPKNHRLP